MENKLSELCLFILTHNRPNDQFTYENLLELGYTGDIYLVIDDEDPSIEEYKEKYDNLCIFNKDEIKNEMNIDMGDNFNNYLNCVIPRNYCFKLAKELGYKYFCELDDDYVYFSYRWEENNLCRFSDKLYNINDVVNSMIHFLENTGADGVAFAQSGDYVGGLGSSIFKNKVLRKLMNSIFFKTDNICEFKGSQNDDVTLYVRGGSTGKLFLTPYEIMIGQVETQNNEGGLTELYGNNTYVKTFYSVMYSPSNVQVSVFPGRHPRIHHRVKSNNAYVKIIDEKYKKR